MRKPPPRKTFEYLSTSEAANVLGVTSRTLMNWLFAGKITEPSRDLANNYRMWRPEEVEEVRRIMRPERKTR